MAKFNVEIDVDFLGEDGSLDDVIKEEIKNDILGKIKDGVIQQIKESTAEIAKNRIGLWVNKFLSEEIETATFPYPESTYEHNPPILTIREILAKEMEKALRVQVNEKGEPVTWDRDRKYTRLDYLVGKAARDMADARCREFARNFPEQINEYLSTKLKEELLKQVSGQLVAQIDLNKAIKEAL